MLAQNPRRSSVREAQDGAGSLATQDEIRLLDQASDIGARVVARHRMIGVAEQSLAVLDGYAGRAQTTAKGVTQVMDANTSQTGPRVEHAAERCCSSY